LICEDPQNACPIWFSSATLAIRRPFGRAMRSIRHGCIGARLGFYRLDDCARKSATIFRVTGKDLDQEKFIG
jgi:hypothetical protein